MTALACLARLHRRALALLSFCPRRRSCARALAASLLAVLVLPGSSSGYGVPVSDPNAPLYTVMTAPAAGSTISGTAVRLEAQTNLAAYKVEFYVDGLFYANGVLEGCIGPDCPAGPEQLGAMTESGGSSRMIFSASWNTLDAVLPAYDGSHVLTSTAYDTAGNVVSSVDHAVTVANTTGTKFDAAFVSTPVPQVDTHDPGAQTQEQDGFDVTVTNESAQTWDTANVKLHYRWVSADGSSTIDGPAFSLGTNVVPGAARIVRVLADPPALPVGVNRSQYKLRFDLYDSATGQWFAAKGNKPHENPVLVNKKLEAEALGLERYYAYDAEQLGAGMEHLVNAANGNALLRWTPLVAPGRGLSTVVDLTYNSLERKSDSPIGDNFSLALSSLTRLGLPLDVHPNNADQIAGRSNKFVEFTDGDGTTHRFTDTNSDGSWEEPPGVHLYLRVYSQTDPARKWALTRPDRVTFFYDQDGHPSFVRDRNGNELAFTLANVPPGDDPGGIKRRVTAVTDAGGRAFTITYYTKETAKTARQRGRIQRISDHTGSALEFDYYEDGNLLRIRQKGGTKADGSPLADRTFVFTYTTSDGSGPAIPNAADRVNPEPRTSNQSTRLYSVRDPRGTETRFAYCSASSCGSSQNRWKLQTRTDRAGSVTSYAYDITNRVTTVTAPLSRVTKYAYGTDGSVTQLTNPKNEVTTLTWSAERHVTKVEEAGGGYTTYAYNDNGYLTEQKLLTDAQGAGTADDVLSFTKLEYQNLAVDGDDVSGRWKAGRTIPHLSQLAKKTDPNGTATATPPDDFEWLFAYDASGNLTRVTDPEGNATEHAWNTNGTLASTTDPRGVVTTGNANDFKTLFQNYDANGFPTRVVNPKKTGTEPDEAATLSYDADGLLLFVQDARHAADTGADVRAYRTYFDYDSFHRTGRTSTPKLTNGERGTLVWAKQDYDPNDNIVSSSAPAYGTAAAPATGATTTIAYDSMDRPTLVTGPDTSADPVGERTQYAYDAAGRTSKVTAPLGVKSATVNDYTTELEYDPLDRVLTETRYPADGLAAGALRTHYCYDTAGDLRSLTPPRGHAAFAGCPADTDFTRKLDYDAGHRLLKETSAFTGEAPNRARQTRQFAYDANGNVLSQTNERGHVTTRAYDERDLLTQVNEPFEAIGTRPASVVTQLKYDPVGNLIEQISPRGADARRLNPGSTDFATKYAYDALNRLVTVTLPKDGTTTQAYAHNAYDALGNLAWTSIPTTIADPATVALPANASQRTNYDHFDPGWIRSSDDHVNSPVTFAYSAEGWQTSRTPAGGAGETWTYFVDGLLREVRDRRNDPTTYAYDANNNLLTATDASGSSGAEPITTDITYDGFDRATKVRTKQTGDPNCLVSTFAYDGNGNTSERFDNGTQPLVADQCSGAEVPGRRHTFEYDPADWLLRQFDYGKSAAACDDDQRIENTFLATGWEKTRVVSRKNAACTDAVFTWETKQTSAWDYFPNGKLKTVETRNGAGALKESHTVEYLDLLSGQLYLNGHRTKDTFTLVGPNGTEPCAAGSCLATYDYDGRDRLTKEVKRGIETKFELSVPGNVECERRDGAAVVGYTYAGNRLQTQTSNCAGNVTAKYWYDLDGNLACVTSPTGSAVDCLTDDAAPSCPSAGTVPAALLNDYRYDLLNRLTRYCSYKPSPREKDDEATYAYDALDRPIEEKESHGPTGTPKTTTFSYLGLSALVTGEEQKTSTGSIVTNRSYGYDAFGHRISLTNTPGPAAPAGKPVAKAGTFTYGYDVHGSTSLLLDSAGATTSTYSYTPYGQIDEDLTTFDVDQAAPKNAPEDLLNPYRYTGKRLDSGSGSYDMGARRFGPDTSRFLQQDLYQGALSDLSLSLDPLTQNRYALAGGNPTSFVEVDGHSFIASAGGGASPSPKPTRGRQRAGVSGGDPVLDFVKDFGSAVERNVRDTGYFVWDRTNFTNEERFGSSWRQTWSALNKPLPEIAKSAWESTVAACRSAKSKPGCYSGEFITAVFGGKGLNKVGKLDDAVKGADDVLRLPAARTWGNPRTLEDHFSRHGSDFGATSAVDYARRASEFLQRAQRGGLPTKIDAEGIIRVYDPRTNTFGAYNPSGTTRTFFKPTSPTYFDRQPGDPIWP
jgi:RHS repeat-associated protein